MENTKDKKELELQIRRAQLIDEFSQIDEITRDERVDRYLEIDRQRIIGSYHFARASTECIDLYRDGHFIATVMTTQAVNEGIIKFVAERNNIQYANMPLSNLLQTLALQNIFSQSCFEASNQIRRSYRNDVHHMNPPVAKIDFAKLAKKNIHNLAVVEREIWATNFKDGAIIPIQPKYWDINPDGTITVALRGGI